MKVYFLGTMGWYDTQLGNTLCVLVDTGKEYVIFDAGGGLYKADRYIKEKRPVYLFLSHLHLDHIIGLHTLDKLDFPQGINIFCPKGTRKKLDFIINTPYSKPLGSLKTKVTIKEINRDQKFPFSLRYERLHHTTVCYGYRLSKNGKTVAFCTDTGPCRGLYSLAGEADLLVLESSLSPGVTDTNWPHLNPYQAAEAARISRARRLALVHFDAAQYPDTKDIKEAEKCARKIFKDTIAARDGYSLNI